MLWKPQINTSYLHGCQATPIHHHQWDTFRTEITKYVPGTELCENLTQTGVQVKFNGLLRLSITTYDTFTGYIKFWLCNNGNACLSQFTKATQGKNCPVLTPMVSSVLCEPTTSCYGPASFVRHRVSLHLKRLRGPARVFLKFSSKWRFLQNGQHWV